MSPKRSYTPKNPKKPNYLNKMGWVLIVLGSLGMTVFGYQFYQQNQTDEDKNHTLMSALTQPQMQQPHMGGSNPVQPVIYTNQSIEINELTKPLELTTSKPARLQEVHGVFNQSSIKLVPIPKKYTLKPEKIHPEAYNSLIDMIDKAQKDNIKLSVVSAFRSYQRQKQIWENKWGNRPNDDINHAKNILKWSSFPGTSRHHWGTDVDFNSVETAYWKSKAGVKVYNWLQNNAPKFGFCQTYDDGRQHGYNSEPWHWSYMPVADRYLAQISNPAVLEVVLNQGVKGSEAVRQSGDLMTYVTSINACQVTYPQNQQQNIQTPQDLPPNDTNQSEQHSDPNPPVLTKPPLGSKPYISHEGHKITPNTEGDFQNPKIEQNN
ncbi:M15 family metallopeptidase [Moraxella catarrhalis]|uniref:D,D-carboxypeptidase family protein n=1 Tax=Moraxella catarrhalis TaxID=480 RepID=A0A198UDK9_MORCA|nr:M15 family metallopeptidase [Moraxella catarrhalis]OAU94474.1 D,D-carboxypeptidase family protein [Moraxella catarrhalis]OAU95453.1 D,D-carboxypeptidase family protein [Moraxella catarrhalis]OAU99461.1 D,D-carboxypeptidase family protein [Moraxella catarrhalis]